MTASRVSLLCLWLLSCLLSLSALCAALGDECVVESSAWVLLRFNLRSASGDAALGSSSSQVQIEVDNSTVARLQAVTTKLAVISIIGPYRTGKSTLLNRLLPPNIPSYVFSVGHTVQPHTEEVSVYVIPPCAVQAAGITGLSADTSLVFVDTPGLFAPNRVALFDAQLLAVLNLISSVVVYNNVGVIKVSRPTHTWRAQLSIALFSDPRRSHCARAMAVAASTLSSSTLPIALIRHSRPFSCCALPCAAPNTASRSGAGELDTSPCCACNFPALLLPHLLRCPPPPPPSPVVCLSCPMRWRRPSRSATTGTQSQTTPHPPSRAVCSAHHRRD